MNLFCFVLLHVLVDLGEADYCQDNLTLSELPGGFFRHAVGTVLQTIRISLFGCFDPSVDNNDVKFLLYTRNNSEIPIRLDPKRPVEIDPRKPIKILVPGWTCNVTNDRMPELKDAYLTRYDCNVIGIDWSAISIDVYPSVFCNSPRVAEILGDFLCNLNKIFNVDLEEVHLLGHSMGAHIAGLAGQDIKNKCNEKLGRITGLDPAGPFYQFLPESQRLDASDASFVDVIHSNMGVLGYYGTCGTVDFFPNCGKLQPGCLKFNVDDSIIDAITRLNSCSHFRSADLMVEGIISNGLLARSCRLCPVICPEIPFHNSYIQMGENCPHNPPDRKYELVANPQTLHGQEYDNSETFELLT